MILEQLAVDPVELHARTGWEVKPEGVCCGATCVPLPDGAVAGGRIDARALAGALGMPLVQEPEHGLIALGPPTLTGRALTTAEAPELVLPDLDGNDFALSSLRGQKVVLVTWASW
jgi:hypothetical protein